MANYTQIVDYYELLAQENVTVSHVPSDPKKQKFFKGNLEQFLAATSASLPGKEAGPFVYFVNYVRNIKELEPMTAVRDQFQFMIFILQGCSPQNATDQTNARDLTEKVALQFVSRMNKDSRESNILFPFPQAFNKADFKLLPHVIKGNIDYIGWQLSFRIYDAYTNCYKTTDWR